MSENYLKNLIHKLKMSVKIKTFDLQCFSKEKIQNFSCFVS